MLLRKLLPKEGNFFELFNEHMIQTVAAAQAVYDLVVNYDNTSLEQRRKLITGVEEAEKKADRITTEIIRLTHQSFITPFDRDQIHILINSMDDIADLFQDIAKSLELYNVQEVNEDIIRFSDVNLKSCIHLQQAISLMSAIGKNDNTEKILYACNEIDKLESSADHIKRVAVTNLFRGNTEVLEVIKLNAIYGLLENVSDICEVAANIVEGIVLENS